MKCILYKKRFKFMQNYLRKYEFSNANQDNLWQELTAQGHFDSTLDRSLTIKEIMDTWTLQKGYPVVNVHRSYNNESSSSVMHIRQSWFLLNPSSKILNTAAYHKYKWFVPFTFTTKSDLSFEFESKPYWLKPNQSESEPFVFKINFIIFVFVQIYCL